MGRMLCTVEAGLIQWLNSQTAECQFLFICKFSAFANITVLDSNNYLHVIVVIEFAQ